MFLSRPATFLAAAVGGLFFAAISLAELYPSSTVRHPVPRVSHIASGPNIFLHGMLIAIGGVLSQGQQLKDESGNTVEVRIKLPNDGSYPGHILVQTERRTGRSEHQYRISYSDLVPMALFVESGGTSLYTAWNDDRLPPNFHRDAGFAPHSSRGSIALEFADTPYATALKFIDFCTFCLAPSDPALVSTISALLPKQDIDPSSDDHHLGSYINTDLSVPHRIHLEQDPVRVSAGIRRISWTIRTSPTPALEIQSVEPLQLPGEQAFHVAIRDLTKLKKEIIKLENDLTANKDHPNWTKLLLEYVRKLSKQEALEALASGKTKKELETAFFLFETLALLRAAKASDKRHWLGFMTALKSDALVNAYPKPWQRYSRSFCRVYPQHNACRPKQ